MKKLILVVDDSKTVRASLEYTLGKAGYDVVSANDGTDGLRRLNELKKKGKRPAMIISDINMPEMDGITFVKEVKKSPTFKFLPILILTTESQMEKKMEGKRAGAAGWLVKPFQPNQLIGVLKKFVK